MRAAGIARTDRGLKRTNNQDSTLTDDALGVYMVCDGMGGYAHGELASRLACDTVLATLQSGRAVIAACRAGREPTEEAVALVERAALSACTAVYEAAEELSVEGRMGTTLTLLLTLGHRAVMAHVGDSRLYRYRANEVSQLSRDHTVAAELVRSGVIPAEGARKGRWGHVLSRAVGLKPEVEVETAIFELEEGDRFLLCSDGLGDYVDDARVLERFLDGEFQAIPDALVEFAHAAGGADNIAIVAVRVDASHAQHALLRVGEWTRRVVARARTFFGPATE